MLERNPVAAWTDGKGTGGVAYFTYDGTRFATSPSLDVPDGIRQAAQDLVREIARAGGAVRVLRPAGVRAVGRREADHGVVEYGAGGAAGVVAGVGGAG